MKLFEYSEYLKLSRERVGMIRLSVVVCLPSRRECIPFYRLRGWPYKRECVCYLVLLPTPSGTRRFVGAHNTIDA